MKNFKGLLIPLLYTVLVSFFVLPANNLSFINGSESLYFDILQQKSTIDSKSDENYRNYATLFSQIAFINIDSSCINSQTDRVKKLCIAKLLDTLNVHSKNIKSIFLDYDFSFLKNTDTLLINNLKPFSNNLISPRLLFTNNLNVNIKNPIPDNLIMSSNEGLNYQNQTAFAYAWKENSTHSYRYYLYRVFTTDMKTYNSVPYMLALKNWPSHNKLMDKNSLDNFKEIKYILRNNDIENKERAIMTLSLSDIINEIPRENLENILKDKIVFIGLFEGYTNKYNQQPDSYTTPVEENMSGILITVNAFLNLMEQNYIEPDKGVYSILLIVIFTLLGGLLHYLAENSNAYSRPILWYFIFIVFSTVGILLITNILWVSFNTRIHFLTSILAVLLIWPLFSIFRK